MAASNKTTHGIEPDHGVPDFVVQMLEKSRSASGERVPRDGLTAALQAVLSAAVSGGICDLAGVTERSRGELSTVAVTEPTVQRLDRAQYDTGQGPCVQTAFEDGLLVSQDLTVDPRWPVWTPEAQRLGVAAIISVQLYSDTRKMGALNLYSRRPRLFQTPDVEVARFLAANASVALATYRRTENLWIAIDARHRIGVAQGILTGKYGLTTEQSFEALRRISSQNEIKLSEVAALIVRHGGIPGHLGPGSSGAALSRPQAGRPRPQSTPDGRVSSVPAPRSGSGRVVSNPRRI